tara:strand:- start:45 stop:401 length:357 start_codon:yes stop_codon:yes gene_type:complete
MLVVVRIPPRFEFFALLHLPGNGIEPFCRIVNLEPFSFGHRRVFCLFYGAWFPRILHAGDVGFEFVLPEHVRYLAVGAGHHWVSFWALWTIGLPLPSLQSFEMLVIDFFLSGQFLGHI